MSSVPKFNMTPRFRADPQNLHWVVRDDREGYAVLARRLKGLIGVDMPSTDKNRVLMACRLAPILRKNGCKSYQDYDRLLGSGDSSHLRDFISALTTHTTDFFRESRHFELFPSVLQSIAVAKRKDFMPEMRIWCAAASSGQEPYTILFSLLESFPAVRRWKLKFLASDIDRVPLIRAAAGEYTNHEMRKVPDLIRKKYFDRKPSSLSEASVVRSVYRRMITFAEFNLAQPQYPFRFLFDIVFCRNVLIYFDLNTGAQVVDRIVEYMQPGGYLFVGHSETGFVRSRYLRPVAPAVFQKT